MKDKEKLKLIEERMLLIDDWIRTKIVMATKTYRLYPGDKTAYEFGYNVGADTVLSEIRGILK